MRRHAAIVAVLLVALPASAGATTTKQYQPKPHAACRAHYVKRVETVKEHKHGKVVKVKQTWCVYVAPKTKTPTTTAATPVLAVHLDPSFTQSPTNPLTVTYTYRAAAATGGSPDSSLPDGVLEFFTDGLLACSENVGGQTNTGTCEVTYSRFGAHTVNVIYDSGTNSATTGTESVTIEPPAPQAITVPKTWGTDDGTVPTISATVENGTSRVSVDSSNFEGATSIVLTDNLNDTCQGTVSGTEATCSMTVSGVPSSFTISYPGGVSTQGTQTVSPWGVPQTQQVTYTWPSEIVLVGNPSITVVAATVVWSGGDVFSGGVGLPGGWTGAPPFDPMTITAGEGVLLEAYASGPLADDSYPLGGIDYGVSPAGPTLLDNQPSSSTDCTDSYNYSGEAVAACKITFPDSGTYVVSTEYVSDDPNYGSVAGPSETIDVTP